MCMPFSLKEQQAFQTGGQKYRSAMLQPAKPSVSPRSSPLGTFRAFLRAKRPQQRRARRNGCFRRLAMLGCKNRTGQGKELYQFHLLSVVFDIKFTWNVITGDVIPITKRNSIIWANALVIQTLDGYSIKTTYNLTNIKMTVISVTKYHGLQLREDQQHREFIEQPGQ